MITVDKNLIHQQNLQNRKIHIILLSEIDWRFLKPQAQKVVEAVRVSQKASFQFVVIRRDP